MPAFQTEIVAPPASVPENAMLSVRVCHSWEELEQFREPWNSLLLASPACSIFQTPEWLAAWWQAFGQDRKLLALIFADGNGSTVGIAPFYVDLKSFLGLACPTLRMAGAGSGDSDALDFITAPGYEQRCAQAFASWLAQERNWSICSLDTFPQKSPVAQHLFQLAQEAGWRTDRTLTPNFVIELPPTWPAYLSQLESSFRPLLTRYPRRLQTRYRVRIFRCERDEDVNAHLPTLFRLHQMRWTGRGETGAFALAARRNFYFRMAAAFLQRGWLEFWLLELDGAIVGAQFCFRYNNTVSLLQEGFDPQFAAEKIGYALRAHVLEECIRSGVRRYDFLGGADAYKARFGAQQANYLNLSFAGPSRIGRAYLALQQRQRQIKSWLKRRLPAGVLQLWRRGTTPAAQGAAQ
jgi:CelD/BcsL family acetyltransferase involved in cellulose biosynthesis